MKIAEIPFLNCAPFFWKKETGAGFKTLEKSAPEWISLPPRSLGLLARRGEIDAGPISLTDSFGIEDTFEPLSNFGIAVKHSAGSVLFFSRKAIEDLGDGRIGLTSETSTSSELLRMILKERCGSAPPMGCGFDDHDEGVLLIGDLALMAFAEPDLRKVFPFVYDLGEEWRKWQDLPFVFARWMVRKDASSGFKGDLANLLERNLKDFEEDNSAAILWHERTRGWSYENARNYLQSFTYRLGEEEDRAISVFRRMRDAPATVSTPNILIKTS